MCPGDREHYMTADSMVLLLLHFLSTNTILYKLRKHFNYVRVGNTGNSYTIICNK